MGDYGFEGAGDYAGSDFPDGGPDPVNIGRRCGGTEDVTDSKSVEETRAGSIPVSAISLNVVDYDILDASSSHEMRDKVKDALGEGWKLLGGVSVTGDTFMSRTYHQSIVKTGTK